MDYSNADGSVAEMCGNGIRVMARYLTDRGHQPSGIYAINTRAGRKFLAVPESGDISVNMGQVSQVPGEITVNANNNSYQGFNIEIGNPHAVVFVDEMSEIGELKEAPVVRPRDSYPEGVNVEFVEIELENFSVLSTSINQPHLLAFLQFAT